jgi:hypothetical protein
MAMDIKPTPILDEPLVDTTEVSEAFRISPRTVENPEFQRRVGLIPIRFGPRLTRFRPSNVRLVVDRLEHFSGEENS